MSRVPLLLALSALLALPAQASAFTGAIVRDSSARTGWLAQSLLVRIQCPPSTQATPRPGDFSFCRGAIRVFHRRRLVASLPFSVRTFDSHIEKVRVRRGARRLFRPGRRIALTWRIRSHDGMGRWAARAGVLTAVNPYSRL
jgi:hypothetical protein